MVTGVCLLQLRGHRQKIFAERTEVKFRPLGAKQIRDYLARINPLDKAGAYAIQEHGDRIVEEHQRFDDQRHRPAVGTVEKRITGVGKG